MNAKPKRDRLILVFAAIIVLMGIEIIYLVIQNRRLSGIISDPKKYFETLSVDEVVPSFTAQDINGNDVSVRYAPGEPHTVIFWFGPTCDYCEKNVDFWKRISSEYSSDRIRFVGMFAGNPGEAKEYVARHALEFPVVCADNSFIVDSYQGHVLPQTVLINPNGTIRDVWPGVVEEDREAAIVAVLETLNR
jgi:peroxiredoxin